MDILHKLKSKLKRPKEVLRIEVIEERCIGCGRCVEMCKREVFEMVDRRAVVRDLKLCVGCGKCVDKMCRSGAIELDVVAKSGRS